MSLPFSENQDDAARRAPGMSPMEILGVMMVRVIHDLSNQLTILSGNAQVLEMVRNNPERLEKVIDRIKTSSVNVGQLLDQFAKFRQSLPLNAAPRTLTDCLASIEALNPFPTKWQVETDAELGGCVALEPSWVAFAIWQVVVLCGAGAGRVSVSARGFPADWSAPGHVPGRIKEASRLMRCRLVWNGPGPWLDEKEATKPSNLSLAAAYEVFKIVEGWGHYQFLPGDEHHFNVFLPLAD